MNLYEGMIGVVFDIEIVGIDSFTGVENASLHVRRPDGTEDQWAVTLQMETKVFRHVNTTPLMVGIYKIQPYFKLGDFQGRWGTVNFRVKNYWW